MSRVLGHLVLAILVFGIFLLLLLYDQGFLVSHDTSRILYSLNLSDTIYDEQLVCDCVSEPNRTSWPCKRDQKAINTIVMHCKQEGKGFFIVRTKSRARNDSGDVQEHTGAFVRLNGPIIDTIMMSWNATISAWVSEYSTCKVGNYTGAVYIYMISAPDAEAVMRKAACMDPRFNTPFTFHWVETKGHAEPCTMVWSWKDRSAEDAATELSRFSQCPPRQDYTVAFANLQNSIPYIDWTAVEKRRKDNDSRLVCFYGDSQVRNLVNTITAQIDSASCDPIEMQAGRASCTAPGFAYKTIHYDTDWNFEDEVEGCSHIFLNYGQWPAAWATDPPWSFAQYRQSVTLFAQQMAGVKSRHITTKIYFLSTNLHSFSILMTPCPVKDYRFPHIIEAYNLAAREAFSMVQDFVGYIDTNRVIRPLFDLSFDCAHYQGPVGVALANSIGNCIYHDVCF